MLTRSKRWLVYHPSETGGLQRLLNKINDRIVKAAAELNKCLDALRPHRVPGAQPQKILEIIHFQNPGGFEDTDDWAPRIAGGEFPLDSGFEWKQVLDSDDEYDQFNSVGATGWAINPRIAQKDTPGLHPFGFDWLVDFAVDDPYTFLLAKGNAKPEEDDDESAKSFKLADDLKIPTPGDLLGVEWDSGSGPPRFSKPSPERRPCSRVWPLDCGLRPQ